eukprot:scaffold30416_cov24-Cyclotella_meneghiniana.AAC.1
MLAKGECVFCFSPGSSVGVSIADKDCKRVVVDKSIVQSPLEIGDIFVSVYGINLIGDCRVSDQNEVKTWKTIISNFS